MLVNMLLDSCDTPMGIIDICMDNVNMEEDEIDIKKLIKNINKVEREDIMYAVKEWKLEVSYYLK